MDFLTTIVIPVFNGKDLLTRSLEAVRSTTQAPVIVSDDGSTDDIEALARQRGVEFVGSNVNTGFAAACNRGARHSRTDYLCFLNSDAYPKAGWLQAMEEQRDRGIVGCRILTLFGELQHAGVEVAPLSFVVWDTERRRSIVRRLPAIPKEIRKEGPSRYVDAVTAACMLVSRKLFWELGGFDEGYRNGFEDVALCLKATHAGHRCWYESSAVVVHQGHASGAERFRHEAANGRRLRAQVLEWSRNSSGSPPDGPEAGT